MKRILSLILSAAIAIGLTATLMAAAPGSGAKATSMAQSLSLGYSKGSGTLSEVIQVYGDDDSVDLSGGVVAEAQEFNKDIEVQLGNGVSVHTKWLTKNTPTSTTSSP